jgi:hypothetical protein
MRRVPRSFFWIDQRVIRGGLWGQMSMGAKLAYVALAASVDRQGVSQWSRRKLMELAGGSAPLEFDQQLKELEGLRLVALPAEGAVAEIRMLNIDGDQDLQATQGSLETGIKRSQVMANGSSIVVHTQTVVRIGASEC